jgi:hypothetical protein
VLSRSHDPMRLCASIYCGLLCNTSAAGCGGKSRHGRSIMFVSESMWCGDSNSPVPYRLASESTLVQGTRTHPLHNAQLANGCRIRKRPRGHWPRRSDCNRVRECLRILWE